MNILIFTKNWIGDVILETPAIRAIRDNFPTAHLIAVTTPRCVDVLEANPDVDEILTFDEKGAERSLVAKLKFMWCLRRKRINKAFLFHRSSTRAQIAYFSGAKARIGYDTKGRSFWLTTAVTEPPRPIHDVHYFLMLLQKAGLRVSADTQYRVHFSEADRREAEELLKVCGLEHAKDLVALNPGANWAPKRWPAAHYRMLAERLMGDYGVPIVITGTAEDEVTAQEILSQGSALPMISLCGKTKIRVLGALLSKCRLLISNDSGPMHIGTGVGTNVIGLFGPTAPQETAPMGVGQNLLVHWAPEGAKLPWKGQHFPRPWMERISVEDVLNVIEKKGLLRENSISHHVK